MKRLAVAAVAAALTTFADFGLAKGAPQPIRRGQLDLSMPIIPPAPHRATSEEKRAIRDHMRTAAIKRARKAEKLRHLVAIGALQAA
jgi:hypothetical protein